MVSRRLDNALRLRDAALRKLRAEGEFEEVRGFGPVLSWDGSGLKIMCRTPFQKIPAVREDVKYIAAAMGRKPNLAYGLDIWVREGEGKGKVLNIEWDEESGEVHIAGFRRCEWEVRVLAFEVEK